METVVGKLQRAAVPSPLRLEFEGDEGLPLRAFLSGEIDYAKAFSMQVRVAAACRRHRARGLIIDLSRVEFLSSSGLAAILNLRREPACLRGGMALCGATAEVSRILRITGMEERLPIVDTPEEAEVLLLYTAAGADTSPSNRPAGAPLRYG
jgi:anti-anti-sigma factor